MAKIRVLVVDDAVVVRRLVADALGSDPDLEVVGTAANGRLALAKMPQLNPDVVTLDIEMPEMDGLETLKAIRKEWPKLPVIMFSTLTTRGGTSTLDALALGATDYVTKPSANGSITASMERVRAELISRIKVFAGRQQPDVLPVRRPAKPALRTPPTISSRIDIVAIGVSTGGPEALGVVIPTLPANFPVPIVVVQHMPPLFTRLLAERLSAKSRIAVQEGQAGGALHPGSGWIAPGDYHMVVERHDPARLSLNQAPPENSCRPSVDVLFRSVAQAYGPHALAVVMTGMGRDGLRGSEAIREAGGQVIAQNEATSVVWGMPGFVAGAGLAERVLPLSEIGPEIVRRTNVGRSPIREATWG
jgi:two-component system chemotaxis response regulator CheB